MQVIPLRRNPYQLVTALCLLCAIVCLGSVVQAADQSQKIQCRPDLSIEHRENLAIKLRVITGWAKLGFDDRGTLRLGSSDDAVGGSMLSRALLTSAMSGSTLIVFEDASNRSDVVFARVIEGRWTRDAVSKPPVHLVLIDFADFSHIIGARATLASFNEGWAVLHEIAHVTHGSADPIGENDIGECEFLINRMRRECGLPERAEYYFGYFPGQERTTFASRYVRLAFDQQSPDKKKKKRHWILWDGALVGGLDGSKQVARK